MYATACIPAAEAFAKPTCRCRKRALRNMAVQAGRPGCVGSHVVHRGEVFELRHYVQKLCPSVGMT